VNLKNWIRITAPALLLGSSLLAASDMNNPTNLPSANPKIPGVTLPNVLSAERALTRIDSGCGRSRIDAT
jgi:hypothetical protein